MRRNLDARRRDRSRLLARIADSSAAFQTCTVPGCRNPTMRAAGVGLADSLCRKHVQLRARHGSALAPSYKATELAPYFRTAVAWIKEHAGDALTVETLLRLRDLLDSAGYARPAMDIKRRSAAVRARVAFARLRDAGIKPERLLAIHIATSALIQDDRDSHRAEEFFLVQTAKAAHRLASGTHRSWNLPLWNGDIAPISLHAYPRSSGRVLRVIGVEIDLRCAVITDRDLEAVRRLKREKYGPHPSQLPGWRPRWRRERDAAEEA